MKSLLFLLLVLFPLLSFCQEDVGIDISEIQQKEAVSFIADTAEEKELNLKFETISEYLFLEYKNKYNDKIFYDSANVVSTENDLYIKTLAGEYHFQKIEYPGSYDFSFYSYLGYLKPLNLHLYESLGRMYSNIYAIDRLTGERFYVDNFSRINTYDILVSKEEDQLLIYNSEGDSPESYIKIYQLDAKKVTEVAGFFSEEWNIEELVWIEKNSFALKTYTEETLDKTQGVFVKQDTQFLKATIIE